MKLRRPTDGELLDGIKAGKDGTLDYIYSKFYPKVKKFVLTNHGSEDESRDIFQEALVSLFEKVNLPDFELRKSFEAYLFTTCKYLWYAALRRNKLQEEELKNYSESEVTNPDHITNELVENRKLCLYIDAINSINSECREMIEMSLGGYSHKEILEALDLSTEGYSRKKLSKCLTRLIKLIKNDRRFKDIEDE